ncbi:uncharacterized protein LOC116296048 [Actinia tenebrosa]|uniref:Uncharacterized protein LOC116296048 n=1 Tax=Actinia tenebrosa TaxID=6105 RepID=A0A6P8HWU8_ACTTE|nr:uncharacterized protein LOC116296048 [Actinia tenebrosa]
MEAETSQEVVKISRAKETGEITQLDKVEDPEKEVMVTCVKKRPLLSTGECPVCGERRKHLRAHLATNKPGHGWSSEKYEQWLFQKQSEQRKDRHRIRACPAKKCTWSGVKLERHLNVHHDIDIGSEKMARLKAKSKIISKKEKMITTTKDTPNNTQDDQSSKSKKQEVDGKKPLSKFKMALLKLAKDVETKKKCPLALDSESEEQEGSEWDERDENDESEDEISEDNKDSEENEACKEQEMDESIGDDVSDDNDNVQGKEANLGPYGPNSMPTNIFESLVRGWNIYLATPDGTEKTPAMIRQMCQHVVTIAKAVDPNVRDLGVFLDKDRLYKRFFKRQIELRKQEKSQGLCSKTLSCYSSSLERFLTYAIKSMKRSLSSDKREALEELKDTQRNWRESWGKTIAKQRADQEWKAQNVLPTVQEIRSINSSSHVKEMREMIMHTSNYSLTPEDAVNVRNYLIFLINTENANRAGPCAKWTIHISNQKTTKTLGGLILNFSNDLRLMIIRYIKYFRQLLIKDGSETDAMFLNSTGSPYTNSHVHHALKQFVAKTGCLREESVSGFSSSMIRHCIVTNTRGLSSPEKNKLASKMGHSRATADRHYNLINKMQAASDAHDTITTLMDGKLEEKALELEAEDEKDEPEVDVKSFQETEKGSDVIPPSENADVGRSSICYKRRQWSIADTKKIEDVCRNEITSVKVPTRDMIIRKLINNKETFEITQREGTERAYQKVKHMRRNYQIEKK